MVDGTDAVKRLNVLKLCEDMLSQTLQECSTCGTEFPAQEIRSKRRAQPVANSNAKEARQ